MADVQPQQSPELQQVLRHADRFVTLLRRLEKEGEMGWWIVGRASELRVVASCAMSDWRARGGDDAKALASIASFAGELHRGTAQRLNWRLPLECCLTDDAITRTFSEENAEAQFPTAHEPWQDSEEVKARFRQELPLVRVLAREMARRFGARWITRDDLVAAGLAGLLDAARSFDESRGPPFVFWASLRIRGSMIDEARRHSGIPRRLLRELRGLQAVGAAELVHNEPCRSEDGGPQRADIAFGARLRKPTMAKALAGVASDAERSGEFAISPEDQVSEAEIHACVRKAVAQLPVAERRIIEGYFFEGLTFSELSVRYRESEASVERTLARGIEALTPSLARLQARS